MPLKAYSQSLVGSRSQNQDAFLVLPDKGLFAVADGVGGGLKGEVASRMAVEGLKLYAPSRGPLTPTIQRVHEDILQEALQTLGDAHMGTTLTAVRILGNEVTLAHVGDSRCYHYTQGLLRLMTEDHEWYDESLGGTVLVSYLGLSPEVQPLKVQEEVFRLQPGEGILLCSDGLYRQLSEPQIVQLIQQNWEQPETLVARLSEEASLYERSDNITVVFVVME